MQISKFVAKVSALGVSTIGALAGLAAHAQTGGVLNIPAVPGLQDRPVGPVILTIIEIGLGVAGSVAVLFLIVGGFLYITAAGDEQRLEKAKTTLKNAIVGTIFILLALVIVVTLQNFLS